MENISKTSESVSTTVNKPVQYGWVCPVCGRGNSPFTSTCPCKPINWEPTNWEPTAYRLPWEWMKTYATTSTGGTVNETR